MGSSQRSSSNEAPQTNALIFLVTAPHLPIHKSPQNKLLMCEGMDTCILASCPQTNMIFLSALSR
jgi:hypothetical protein